MHNIDEARQRWIAERPTYEAFGSSIAQLLRDRLKNEGMWADVSSRAKEVDSLVKKLILKPHKEYESVGDKSGVRVILRYKDQVDEVLGFLNEILQCEEIERKVDTMNTDQFGYQSAHVDVKVLRDHELAEAFPPDQFSAELQVRTLAQHLWSEMSHDSIYKNNDGLADTSEEILRRAYCLSAVVELADDEFNRINSQMNILPEVDLYRAIERNYFKLTGRRGDTEMSMNVIQHLMPLFDGRDIKDIIQAIDNTLKENYEMLSIVFDSIDDDDNWSAYLFQPESLLIYTLLLTDRYALQEQWNMYFSEIDLERIANKFGESLS